MRPLADRVRVAQFREAGLSSTQIVAQTGFWPPFVARWMNRDPTRSLHKGWAKKATGRVRQIVKRLLKKRNRPSVGKVSARLGERHNVLLSPTTVHRMVKSLGLNAYKRHRRPALTDRHKQRRLQFADQFKRQDWSCVLFTDEKTFEIGGRPRNDYVYCASIDQVPHLPTNKHPAKVHVWAGMSRVGKTSLHIFNGNMDAEFYISILDEHLDEINALFDGGGFVFQQDNDPKHTSKKAQRWIAEHMPEYITPDEWPSQSPDLNPIEHLWAILQDRVYSRQPRNMEQLKRILRQEWNNIEIATLENLVDSMPRRLQAVQTAEGGNTRY